MEISNKLTGIRAPIKSNTKKVVFSIIYAFIIGAVLGLVAKLVDSPGINPIFDHIGSRLGVWIFVATLLSVFSDSPKQAAIKVFTFFVALLTVYYVYTVFILHFFPQKVIIFWSICAVISPICAYMMWYSGGNGLFSNIMLSLPAAVLLAEGYNLRNAYLPIHTHYYLIPWMQGIYLLMIIILFLSIAKKGKHLFLTLLITIGLSLIFIYFNVLGRIFGGMNGFL